MGHLIAHLRGEITLGTYLLDQRGQGRFLVLDADDEPDWRRLKALAEVLTEEGAPGYLEPSRRGGHLWLFLPQPLPGADIRAFGRGLLNHFGIEKVELFPKQDKLITGPGSLVRLPFGVHRKSGRRYGFYLPNGLPLAPTLRAQIQALRAPEIVSTAVIERFRSRSSDRERIMPSRAFEGLQRAFSTAVGDGEDLPLSTRIKAAISVRQFVLRYVELSPQGRGRCPFHDDQVASFSVNDDGNYWSCFACGTGGSVIDFWMRWQQCDFQTAIKELAEMVL
jgi:hypothetical protein